MNLIFDIKHFAINDGPGIRTTFFLKGCPLSCVWCHNPESISTKIQKLYTKSKCIGSLKCIEVCPNNALTLTKDGIKTDWNKCKLCGLCAEVCPTKAIEMSGKLILAKEILEIAENERPFYEESGGGVTFSGGEPLMHCEFLLPILKELGKRKIHRTIDTTGFASPSVLKKIAKHTDLFLYDLKLIDSEKHLKFTGQRNEVIISNLKWLSEIDHEIIIRIPLIKGVNSNSECIEKMAKLISSLSGKPKQVNLLPYHDIAKMKYEKLGDSYQPGNISEPSEDEIETFRNIFKEHGLEVIIGG